MFTVLQSCLSGVHLGFSDGKGPKFEMGVNVQDTKYKLEIL